MSTRNKRTIIQEICRHKLYLKSELESSLQKVNNLHRKVESTMEGTDEIGTLWTIDLIINVNCWKNLWVTPETNPNGVVMNIRSFNPTLKKSCSPHAQKHQRTEKFKKPWSKTIYLVDKSISWGLEFWIPQLYPKLISKPQRKKGDEKYEQNTSHKRIT